MAGPHNETYITLKVTYGGDFTKTEAHTCKQPKVVFVEWVNLHKLDMEMFGRTSKTLKIPTLGYSYMWNTYEQLDLEMIKLEDNSNIAHIKKMIKRKRFEVIQHVYVNCCK